MKVVLILGSQGMLGRDLMAVFSEGYRVFGLSKHELDITRQKVTRDIITDVRPDLVINAAGYTDVDGCEKLVRKAFAVNGEAVKNVAKACKYCGAKLIHISSDYIFDGETEKPYNEDATPNPKNIYGESKLLGERYVERLLDDFLIIRTQWLYGSHGRNFVESILSLVDKTDKIEVVNDQIGCPTYTMDVGRAIMNLASKNLRGIFHVSSRGSCSWDSFALEILWLSGKKDVEIIPISSGNLNRPAKRPLFSVLSCQKLKRETGIDMKTWQQGLKEYFQDKKGTA